MKYKTTNVIRKFKQNRLSYKVHYLENAKDLTGTQIAQMQGQDVERVFKTLVTVGKSKTYYVFMVSVASELDLKKAAKACGEKSIEMIKSKELLAITGYVHGGCSPLCMKKEFTTYINSSVSEHDIIYFSAGQIGLQIETTLENLIKMKNIEIADIV